LGSFWCSISARCLLLSLECIFDLKLPILFSSNLPPCNSLAVRDYVDFQKGTDWIAEIVGSWALPAILLHSFMDWIEYSRSSPDMFLMLSGPNIVGQPATSSKEVMYLAVRKLRLIVGSCVNSCYLRT
jgi:hypothetical protein